MSTLPGGANGGAPPETRNAALLLDEERRAFLACIEPGVANSYAYLYKHHGRWVEHCKRVRKRWEAQLEAARKAGAPRQAVQDAERRVELWARLEEAWASSFVWLDTNLILTGSVRGKRSDQLVQALVSENGRRASADGLYQVGATGQPMPAAPAPERGGWLFKRR